LFAEDVFFCGGDLSCELLHSVVRNMKNIPGVLCIDGFNTFGSKKGKPLYKCIPDDTRLPTFLVPYEIKHLGFSKDLPNLYVTIQYANWDDKHPIGTLSQNIGRVNVLEHFYEYQLYCKSLNHSIQKFNQATEKKLKTADTNALITDAFNNIKGRVEDRTSSHYVFSIDPQGCADYDDAFSINQIDGGGCTVSVYISNVPVLIDSLNLWSSFSQRISTIYLPDKKRPMLPTILSDGLCSLQEKHDRIAYVMDMHVTSDGVIDSVAYLSCKIRVARNFVYEEPSLLKNNRYQLLCETVGLMSRHYRYIGSIQNSHDIVAYLMILMNNYCAKRLARMNRGVFRVTKPSNQHTSASSIQAPEANKFIEIWNSVCGQYVDKSGLEGGDLTHTVLNLREYVHITSPIRRIVDLLNMIMIQQCDDNDGHDDYDLPNAFSQEALNFVSNWLAQLDYINTTMRSIRKVQSDCDFLSLCLNDETALTREYDGHCFDRVERADGLFQYNVFLPSLKLAHRITTSERMEHLELRKYKLYLFSSENKFKRKIRLQIVG
jgi:exoribonuclease R